MLGLRGSGATIGPASGLPAPPLAVAPDAPPAPTPPLAPLALPPPLPLVHKVVALLGQEHRARLLEEASDPLRQFVKDGARGLDSWVPTAFLIEVLVLADRIAGTGDLSMAWQLGLEIAKSEIGPVQAI